nr:hypothetical protein Iba_chr12cCG14970 [Ipomoea batatas]
MHGRRLWIVGGEETPVLGFDFRPWLRFAVEGQLVLPVVLAGERNSEGPTNLTEDHSINGHRRWEPVDREGNSDTIPAKNNEGIATVGCGSRWKVKNERERARMGRSHAGQLVSPVVLAGEGNPGRQRGA